MTLRCKDIVLSIVRHTTGIEQIADCFFCTVISHFVGNKVAELNGRIGKRECDGLRLILLGLSIYKTKIRSSGIQEHLPQGHN